MEAIDAFETIYALLVVGLALARRSRQTFSFVLTETPEEVVVVEVHNIRPGRMVEYREAARVLIGERNGTKGK